MPPSPASSILICKSLKVPLSFTLKISPFEDEITSFSPFVNISSVFISLSCATISSTFIPVSCAIISSVALLSAALIQDKLIKANKIIVAIITLCLIKIPPICIKTHILLYIYPNII
jgi:hypothetical protein